MPLYIFTSLIMSLLFFNVTEIALASDIRQCTEYSLAQTFPKVSVGERSSLFVECAAKDAEPKKFARRLQYSPQEIDFMSQAFVDIADCLEIDYRDVFPKFFSESGFHPRIQNLNGDAGIGQLTHKAIKDVENNLNFFKKVIVSSSKLSCQKIRDYAQKHLHIWKNIYRKSKCNLMADQTAIFKNILYALIYHKLSIRYVDHEFNLKNIPHLLVQAGFHDSGLDQIKKNACHVRIQYRWNCSCAKLRELFTKSY